MSNSPESCLDLEDLDLQLLPAWAKQSPDANRYAKYEGEGESRPRGRDYRETRGPRPDRRPRDAGGADRPRRPKDDRGGPPRRGAPRPDRTGREARPEPVQPLPEVTVHFVR